MIIQFILKIKCIYSSYYNTHSSTLSNGYSIYFNYFRFKYERIQFLNAYIECVTTYHIMTHSINNNNNKIMLQ